MFKVTATTRAWLILTNFHGTAELNITNNYVRGTRTLSWANPYEYVRYLFATLSDAHNYSALLSDWGARSNIEGNKRIDEENKKIDEENKHIGKNLLIKKDKLTEHADYRDQVTFMLIPPQKELTFLIGFAAPQEQRDERAGGGVQLRLKNLPAGVITIQTPLQLKQSHTMDVSKGGKGYDLDQIYETAMQALENYLDSPAANGISIPNSIFTPSKKIYTSSAEVLEKEELEKDDLVYCDYILKQFDVSKYVEDKFQIQNIEEIETVSLLSRVA